MTGREQTRRDAQEIIQDTKGVGVFMPRTAAVLMAQRVIALLTELEQAEVEIAGAKLAAQLLNQTACRRIAELEAQLKALA